MHLVQDLNLDVEVGHLRLGLGSGLGFGLRLGSRFGLGLGCNLVLELLVLVLDILELRDLRATSQGVSAWRGA